MVTRRVMFLQGCNIELAIEIGIQDHILEQYARVPKPKIMFRCHPGRYIIFRTVTIVV